ncbi:MAG TPA: UvrD-helicase domain-containing protein [Chloroflexota bacterium]|nr:UvrD-helicase domain-containing protein [Chloroflexota bacterium]
MTGPLAADIERALRPTEPAARPYLDGLNQPQRQVATRGDGPLLVVAGPGAGKTRAIVARAAHLVVARGASPRHVMAITFSRRAAGELQTRFASLVEQTGTIWAGTFHALGARILRRGGAALFDRPERFTIYDRDDTERALRRILTTLDVPPTAVSRLVVPARQAISLAKRRGETPTGELTAGDTTLPLDDVFRHYGEELRAALAFDFDDLVGLAAAALDHDAALREWAQGFARHLLVDEYQDTDPAQEGLLRRLSPPPHDLCVVADPQQSIYAFRGALPEQVQRFLQRWPTAGVIRLEQNYRSTKSIVAIARRLVAPFSASILEKQGTASRRLALALKLWTDNPPGGPARLWVAPHPEKEGDAIAADVAAKLAGGWPAGEIAVLVRTHAQARPIEASLLRAGVPYVLVGGVRFYAREEIKDLLAYLRVAALPEDAAGFWRVVNTPRRGLGPAALLRIARFSLQDDERGPLAGARAWARSGGAPEGLYDFLAHVDELTAIERAGAGPRAVLTAALSLTGYRDHVRKTHPDDAGNRLEAIDELLRIAERYADSRRFLDDAVLSSEEEDAGPAAAPAGRVRVSTVHAAKGLEFRAVYVPGCELGLFPLAPSRRTAGDQADADAPPVEPSTAVPHHVASGTDPEERRVFYVAITRAKEELTLSYCTFRREGRTEPSPYLRELGSGLVRRTKLGTSEPAARRPAAKKSAAKRAKRTTAVEEPAS